MKKSDKMIWVSIIVLLVIWASVILAKNIINNNNSINNSNNTTNTQTTQNNVEQIELDSIDNKDNSDKISVNKKELYDILDQNLNELCNELPNKDVGVNSFVITAWYDKETSQFFAINYIVYYTGSDGIDFYVAALRVSRNGETTFGTYSIVREGESYPLVSNDILGRIISYVTNLANRNYSDTQRGLVISYDFNGDVYREISTKFIRRANITNTATDDIDRSKIINEEYNNKDIDSIIEEENENNSTYSNNEQAEEREYEIEKSNTVGDIKFNFTNFVYNPATGALIELDIEIIREGEFTSTTKGITATVNGKDAPSVGYHFAYKPSEEEAVFDIVVTDSINGKTITKTVNL